MGMDRRSSGVWTSTKRGVSLYHPSLFHARIFSILYDTFPPCPHCPSRAMSRGSWHYRSLISTFPFAFCCPLCVCVCMCARAHAFACACRQMHVCGWAHFTGHMCVGCCAWELSSSCVWPMQYATCRALSLKEGCLRSSRPSDKRGEIDTKWERQ
jgi:hypothetical protein